MKCFSIFGGSSPSKRRGCTLAQVLSQWLARRRAKTARSRNNDAAEAATTCCCAWGNPQELEPTPLLHLQQADGPHADHIMARDVRQIPSPRPAAAGRPTGGESATSPSSISRTGGEDYRRQSRPRAEERARRTPESNCGIGATLTEQKSMTSANQSLNVTSDEITETVMPWEMMCQDYYMDTFKLFRHPVMPDGNCLFRAVSQSLYGHQGKHEQLRRQTVDYIERHFELYGQYFESEHTNDIASVDEAMNQLNRLRQSGSWGGQECLMALSEMLGVDIVVIFGGTGDSPRVTGYCYSCVDYQRTPVFLAWNSVGHYDSVKDWPPLDLSTPTATRRSRSQLSRRRDRHLSSDEDDGDDAEEDFDEGYADDAEDENDCNSSCSCIRDESSPCTGRATVASSGSRGARQRHDRQTASCGGAHSRAREEVEQPRYSGTATGVPASQLHPGRRSGSAGLPAKRSKSCTDVSNKSNRQR